MFDAPQTASAKASTHNGMQRRWQPLTAATASTLAASLRLFGDDVPKPNSDSTRGEMLRYVLHALYGADYRRRGALLLGVSRADLSRLMTGRVGVSRRIADRLQDKLRERMRTRRGEVRDLGAMVSDAFEAHLQALDACPEIVAQLSHAASEARFNHQPHSSETGRFVPRVPAKTPVLTERPIKRARDRK